jgi:hypothetical protein
MDISTAEQVICDACGEGVPSTWQPGLPDSGWSLPFQSFGYYGGFSDDLETELGIIDASQRQRWLLCHDCVMKFLFVFPQLAKFLQAGQHPCVENTPCCQFAWRVNPQTNNIQVAQLGQWVDKPNSN